MSGLSISGIWKPGNAPPTTPKNASMMMTPKKTSSTKMNKMNKRKQNDAPVGNKMKTPKSSENKKLSGSTMNMRFMQRKKSPVMNKEKTMDENMDHSSENNSYSPIDKFDGNDNDNDNDNDNGNGNGTVRDEMKNWRESDLSNNPMHVISNHSGLDNDYKMNEMHHTLNKSDMVMNMEGSNDSQIQIAIDTDMYGMSAELIGRRSFGGFNQAVQDTWSSAYSQMEKSNSRKKKLSDKEMIQKYKSAVHQNGNGNDSKSNRKERGNKRRRS